MLAQPSLDFVTGKALFEKTWVPAPASTTASDGLGPYYNARSCHQCHAGGGRGNRETSLVLHSNDPVYGQQLQKYAIGPLAVEATATFTQLQHEHGLVSYSYLVDNLAAGPMQAPAISPRLAPALHGLGLLALIPESVLLALADENDSDGDGISGRINWVTDAKGGKVAGRFGWKAAQPSLERQVARALSLDLGIGNPVHTSAYGDCQAAQEDCLQAPHGNSAHHADLEANQVALDLLLTYVRELPAPTRSNSNAAGVAIGERLFLRAGCADCHRPEMNAAGQVLAPYTDLLLHDMGPGLADALAEGVATGNEWRTSPLWGLGRSGSEFLHDGRARTLHEAILWHGGEAQAARQAYLELHEAERSDLISFLNSL